MLKNESFSTISKAANIIGVQSHVLRFWEKKFLIITPKKSTSGRRYYSSLDIKYLLMIKKLLYDEGFTIKGAVNFIDKKYGLKTNPPKDKINDNIALIKSLINDGLSLIRKNLD